MCVRCGTGSVAMCTDPGHHGDDELMDPAAKPAGALPDAPPKLPEGLRDCSFERSGCAQVPGEPLLAARARGRAAECAQDALMLLRRGDVAQAVNLLDSARYYAGRHAEKTQGSS